MKLTTQFLFAGKASFVVENTTGITVTVKLTACRYKGTKTPTGRFFVNVRLQNGEWTYLGIVNPAIGRIKLTPKSRAGRADLVFRVAQWAIAGIMQGYNFPTNYRIEHTGRCGRCGKMLRDDVSIARGIGPDCAKLMNVALRAA